ncbi:MAG: hypothetical protein CMB80_26570 [Flammeovirgaceae bacterium]|nr:hypothetical protein [Flammeovirgaceae bacterium]
MSGITNERTEYTKYLPQVKKNRDCFKGQRAVKEGGTLYLPPLASQLDRNGNFTHEGQQSYEKYLRLALFYGATGITVNGFSGLVFRKNPTIEYTPNTEYLENNVRAKNETLISQMQKAVEDAMITPRSGLLVDFPDVKGRVSRAEAEAQNLRPKILHYPFESIINWHFETINNQYQLQFIVLKETTTKVQDYAVTDEDAYRLLELIDGVYHHSLYDDSGNQLTEKTPVLVNGELATEIPFYLIEPVGDNRSLIDDLVDCNLNHYNMFASYANKEHSSGFPIFYETGVDGDSCEDQNNTIGPGVKWISQNPDAQFGVVETSGDGGSLRTYLEDRKSEMASLGADALSPKTNNAESGESKKLDKVGQNATVADVANTVSRAYEQAMGFAAQWVGDNPEDISVQLNTDYVPTDMNPQLLTALMASYQAGNISYQTFWSNLQRGEIADPEVTAEEEKERINNDNGGLNQ